jgi:uncharacterized protein YdaU (DUF1376 family)
MRTPRGMDWYKREPRAFLDGVRRLSQREIAVYSIVLDLIYDGGGRTAFDPKHIASYFSDLGAAAVRNSIAVLISFGKLEETDGCLTNKRATNEAKTREELRKNRSDFGRLGGVSSGISRDVTSKNNNLTEANGALRARVDKNKRREERENTPTGGVPAQSGSDLAGKVGAPTLEAQAYSLGKAVLGNSAGGIVTKLKKHHAGDFHAVIATLRTAESKSSPMEWVSAVLRNDRAREWDAREAEIYGSLR